MNVIVIVTLNKIYLYKQNPSELYPSVYQFIMDLWENEEYCSPSTETH